MENHKESQGSGPLKGLRVVELGTGRVLGFRRTIKEARWLAAQLERGERPQVAA